MQFFSKIFFYLIQMDLLCINKQTNTANLVYLFETTTMYNSKN